MIFFLILKSKRPGKEYGDVTVVIDSALETYPKLKEETYQVIAWNEIYPLAGATGIDGLLAAIMAAARGDAVCIAYRDRAIAEFGLDPFLDDAGKDGNISLEAAQKILRDTLQDWVHPMIGNLAQSPGIRPATKGDQYIKNWNVCRFIDDDTKAAVELLFTTLPPLTRAARDQVRICYNIVDLARAFIGEVSSYFSRQLEEILALRMCKSLPLHRGQITLIKAFLVWHKATLSALVKAHDLSEHVDRWENLEYCRYYLPADVQTLNGNQLWRLVEVLIQGATLESKTENYVLEELAPKDNSKAFNAIVLACKAIWRKIPPTVRCAILMNDFRSIWIKNSKSIPQKANFDTNKTDKFSMTFTPPLADKKFNGTYQLKASANSKHVPEFSQPKAEGKGKERSNWGLAWSWNRHERHPATITYRHFLCPLWAGPSGHTEGGLQFWSRALDTTYTPEGSTVICTGLFTLWRLYYDKRISGFHTLVETFEASCNQNMIGDIGTRVFPIDAIDTLTSSIAEQLAKPLTDQLDDFELLVKLARAHSPKSPLKVSPYCIDPIRLLQLVKYKYYDSTKGSHVDKQAELNRIIIQAKDNLTDRGYKIIQWTDAISPSTGTAIQGFDLVLSNINFQEAVPDAMLPKLRELWGDVMGIVAAKEGSK